MNDSSPDDVGGLHPESPGWIDQLAIAMAASGQSDPTAAADIRIDQGDRVPVAPDARESAYLRGAKVVVMLAISSGLASAALLGAQGFLTPAGVPPPPAVTVPNVPAAAPAASKGHRLATQPAIVRPTDRAAGARPPARPKVRPPTRVAEVKPVRVVAPAAPSTASYVPPAPPPASLAPAAPETPSVEARLTPVPETPPTTIEGWVLRDVANGTAVLEGPDGLRRVRRGDTVPGIGQVVDIFGWGNRLIVATSTGLISTP